jgi:cytochrome b561
MQQYRNSDERYGLVARILHWGIGALIVLQLAVGFYTFEFAERDATRSALVNSHKALGVLLLLFVLARLAWRAYDAPPQLPASIGPQERTGARVGHWLLYILMVAMPVLGLLTSDTGGRPTDVFGLFVIPVMVGEDEGLHEVFEDAHKFGAYALGLLVLLHVGAAIRHHRRKDGVADRML